MRRAIRIVLLALGTTLGYGFAIHSMRHHYHGHCGFERMMDGDCEHGDRPPRDAPLQKVPTTTTPEPLP